MSDSSKSPDKDAFLGPPSSTEPAHTMAGQDAGGSASPAPESSGTEEPQFGLEPDLPSDGRDEVGEAMIRELPQRPELFEPPSQPDPFSQTS